MSPAVLDERVPQVLSYEERTRFVEVVFRAASRFGEIRTPPWAKGPADRYAPGSLVKVGRLKSSGRWVVVSVLVPRSYSQDEAAVIDAARAILHRVEH